MSADIVAIYLIPGIVQFSHKVQLFGNFQIFLCSYPDFDPSTNMETPPGLSATILLRLGISKENNVSSDILRRRHTFGKEVLQQDESL